MPILDFKDLKATNCLKKQPLPYQRNLERDTDVE